MALNGSTSIVVTSQDTLKFSWSATQNISNNTSTISWKMELIATSAGYISSSAPKSWEVVINGITYSGTNTIGISNNSTKTLASGTTVINHDADGTKSFSYSFSQQISINWGSTYIGTKNGSGTGTLDTIPRSSSITSAANIILGNACSIKWIPASTSFYYKLKFILGNKSYTTDVIHPNQTTEYTYTGYTIKTDDYAPQIPNDQEGTMTVYLYTFNSSSCTTQIGLTSQESFTVTVPTTIIPTISSASVTIDNSANSVIADWGLYVVGYSKSNITAIASGSYGSTISSFTINGGYSKTINGTSLNYTGDEFNSSGTKTFEVTAKDSRGRSSESKTAGTITVYEYSKPTMSSFIVSRLSSDTKKMVAKADWDYSSVNGKNSTIATLYYKKMSDKTWIPYGTISKNTNTTLDNAFDEASSYNFRIIITDSLSNSAQSETTVSTVDVLLDFRAGGKGLGIGKISELDNVVDSAWSIKEQGKFLHDKYAKRVNLYKEIGVQDDYCYTVIGLCETSALNSSTGYSSVGRLTFHRDNGLTSPILVDIAIEDSYGKENGINVTRSVMGWNDINCVQPCTFKYNGKTYGGVKVFFQDAGMKNIDFYGISNFDIFAIDYYNNNSGVINSEIYESLVTQNNNYYSSFENIQTKNIYTNSSLYTGGKTAWNDGKTGILIGGDGNVSAEGSQPTYYFYHTGNTSPTGYLQLSTSGNMFLSNSERQYQFNNDRYRVMTDDSCYLGDSSYKWKAVYAVNGAIQTSDRNKKENIIEISKKYEDLFDKLKPVTFEFKGNEHDRVHVGFIAQDVKEAMEEVELTDKDFAAYCVDKKKLFNEEKGEDVEVLDENGEPINMYSLRYTEFIALNTHMIQKQQKEIDSLKKEISELKELIKNF